MKKLLCALCAFVLMTGAAWAAGSTCTVKKIDISDMYKIYIFSWTSDDSAGSLAVGACTNCSDYSFDGRITGVEFRSGSVLPTTGYDVELLDQSGGRDVLIGKGANIASAITDEATQFRMPTNADGGFVSLFGVSLYPYIINAGNSKTGEIIIHFTGR